MKVFLGGTVNGSRWREVIIPKLKVDYFDPVVPEWNDEAWQRELKERQHCDFVLYVITPKMLGYYAIAEVVDDSYKRPDRCIYCYVPEDDGIRFDPQQIETCERVGRAVEDNGGIWLKTLDEVAEALNTAEQNIKSKIHFKQDYNNVFISYGRRHSLTFASKLNNALGARGITSWFDMNDIPLGVDFQEQIDQGIENADNFIFIISPHSVKSEYCLREVLLAIKYGKRIIPILHVEPSDCWDKMHPVIEKLNWVYMREQPDETVPQNQWAQLDHFEHKLADLVSLIELQKESVRMHTILLHLAVLWDSNQRIPERLLVGKDRTEALEWLNLKEFKGSDGAMVQAPYQIIDLQAEFICESEKNAHNLMSDVFFSFATENRELERKIAVALMKNAVTSWTHEEDIKKGANFNEAILKGIEQADSFVYLISKEASTSEYCRLEVEYAIKLNKRIIPLLIELTDDPYLYIPKEINNIQYIDFTSALSPEGFEAPKGVANRREKSPFDKKISSLYSELIKERAYYNLHKVFLVQALKWEHQNKNDSILLRGFSLENAKSWLELGNLQPHKPLPLHEEFISTSDSKAALVTSLDVFVSYSRTDSELARQINENLQLSGKTTWFDQESIASGADFQAEINKGIENSDNFLFLISPDAVDSVYCAEEVEYAKSLNKRFVTALSRPTPIAKIHPDLASVQWIDFTKKDFLIAFGELSRTLEVDREYVKDHTKWALRSTEWKFKDESSDLLLKGSEFIIAQDWLEKADAEEKKPRPTITQRQFIEASNNAILAAQKQERKRVRLLWLLLLVSFCLLLVAIYVSILAFSSKRKAVDAANSAQLSAKSAVKARLEAEMQKSQADKERERAEDEKKKAVKAGREAEIAKNNALINLVKAEKERKRAEEFLEQVKKEKTATEQQRLIAQQSYEKAMLAEKLASQAKDQAMFQLYLFNAKEFANKSVALQNNNHLKSLLAMTSYQLKKKSTELSEKYDFVMRNDPEVLESLQQSYLTFNKNTIHNGVANTLESSGKFIVFSVRKGYLCFANLVQPETPRFPHLLVKDSILMASNAYLQSVAFSSDGSRVACGTSDGLLVLYDMTTKAKSAVKLCMKSIVSVSYLENRNLVIAESFDEKTFIYDFINKKILNSYMPLKSLHKINEKTFICLDEKGDLNSGELSGAKLILKPLSHGLEYKTLNVSKEQKLIIAVSKSGELYLSKFNEDDLDSLKKQQPVLLPHIHHGIRTLIQFSSDNKWLATGSLDGYICLWNLEDKKNSIDKLAPIVISNNKKQIFTLCFDPSDDYLIYGDNSLHIYPLDIDKTYSKLNTLMGNKKLSDQKWQYYKRGDLEKPE